MKMYNHHKVSESFLVNNVKNKPVAVITDGVFNFIPGSGASKEEVERYCIEEGLITKPAQCVGKYHHQQTAGGYMIRDDRNSLVGLVEKGGFTPLNCSGREEDVRLYCINNGLLCK